jgi:hypothetical protein
MFILKLFDRIGNEVKEGDLVKISDGRRFSFFAEVKYLESEGIITPFHTFSFHSFEKIDKVPEGADKSGEERYNVWFICHEDSEEDEKSKEFERYLLSWRECEHKIDNRSYRITKPQ